MRSEDSSMGSHLDADDLVYPVHVEVRLSQRCSEQHERVRQEVLNFLGSMMEHVGVPSVLSGWQHITALGGVERIAVSELSTTLSDSPTSYYGSAPSIPISQAAFEVHIYQLSDSDVSEEYTGSAHEHTGESEVMAATVVQLPNVNLEGMWESLIYPDDIKMHLLEYIYSTTLFSDANVDFNIVSWNRVALLHGPPGTGKTSLCRALAQKLSIRLASRYSGTRLLEINSHSLFSRWFSESGKLVQKLFQNVTEMLEEGDNFVVVLIDEVESLTAARAGVMSGSEPSDALRVVNALLTQLDKLKHHKNVLVMATSNLAQAIDSAFVDRADIIQYIDLPPREAIYGILRSCLTELIAKGLINPIKIPNIYTALLEEDKGPAPTISSAAVDPLQRARDLSFRLLKVAEKCRAQEMSGRSLRRLPVIAHARYIASRPAIRAHGATPMVISPPVSNGRASHRGQRGNGIKPTLMSGGAAPGPGTNVELWLTALERALDDQTGQRLRFTFVKTEN